MVLIEKLHFQRTIPCSPGKILDGDVHLEMSIPVVLIEIGPDPEILDVEVFCRKKKHIAEDPAQVPKILVLEVGSIAPAINLDGKGVPLAPEMRRDLKFRGRPAPLTVADPLAVHPKIERRFHAGKMDKNPPFPPIVRNLEFEAIGPHRVVIVGDMRRIGLAKGIRHIGIYGDPKAIHLPVRGHRDRLPFPIVVIRPVKIHDSIRRFFDPAEFPGSVERTNIRSFRRITLES
jgi:hypothetical protein